MILTLDEEIKKDKENQRRKEGRESFKHRRAQHYNYSHQDQYKCNYSHKVYNLKNKKNYEDKYSPQQRQRSVIKISNLHYSVDKQRLETICSFYGKVKTCRIDWDKMGRSNQTATVEYFNRQDWQKALKQLNGTFIQGQQIKLQLIYQSSPAIKKQHQITKSFGKYASNKYYRRG